MGVVYVLILGLILILYSSLLGFSLHQILYRDLDSRLRTKTQEIKDLLNAFIKNTSYSQIHSRLEAAGNQIILHQNLSYAASLQDTLQMKILNVLDQYELRRDYVILMDRRKEPITISNNIAPGLLSLLTAQAKNFPPGTKESLKDLNGEGKSLRAIIKQVPLRGGDHYFIQIATPLSYIQKTNRKLFSIILVLTPIVLILASSVGQWLAAGILKPVMAVAKTAEKITHEDLSARVRIQDVDLEMQSLVHAFNNMIERLEQAFKHISEFSSHVAHELKTPLAVIRGESEIALRKERRPAEYQEALEANLRETRRMIRVIEDMLLLARLDYDPRCLEFKTIDFSEFFEEICKQSKILAEGKEIQVDVQPLKEPVQLSADPLHLRRLFFNLIDNAIKFTPTGGRVRLLSELISSQQVSLSIADNGPGITPVDVPKIFDPFFHQDKPGAPSGNGLGLSIALSIAKAHGGDIQVKNLPEKGTAFTVTLPAI